MELWARKRPVEGRGYPYEYITSFYDENNIYYMVDTLDKEIYQECMVIREQTCLLYKELDKPKRKVLKNEIFRLS